MNNLANFILLKTYINILLIALFLIISNAALAQQNEFNTGVKYIIEDITVSGNTNFSPQTVVTFSGLRKGEQVTIPGEQISNALKKLWKTNLFSSVDVYLVKTEGDLAYLEINLNDLPELNEVTINGVKKSKIEDLITENKLTKGVKITENLITTTRNYITNKYKKDGFYNTKVAVSTSQVFDSIEKSRVDMVININKDDKLKIKKIVFEGNEKLSDKKLRKAMKNTKQKNPIRFLKRSKYVQADYKTDLVSVIDKYKENGYRDARVISDSVYVNDDNTLGITVNIQEGEKYTYGKITFVGNSVYNDQQLHSVLRIKEGYL